MEKNPAKLVGKCAIDHSVSPSPIYHGGERNAHRRLKHFLTKILPHYDETRSRPEIDGVSRLSSYLHFGFLSPLEIALAVRDADAPQTALKLVAANGISSTVRAGRI